MSLGVPVFNGERYLAETLKSLCEQSFADLEIVVVDNASTDATESICRAAAAKDPRVRYSRNASNLGAAANFNRAFQAARGKYFKWVAHDDFLGPDFVARCVEELEQHPDAVLALTRACVLDENDRHLGEFSPLRPESGSASAVVRYRDLVLNDRHCYEVFGLARRDALGKTRLISSYIGSDRVLRVELGLLGPFREAPGVELFFRDHPERSIRAMPSHHQRAKWFDPKNRSFFVFPHWRIPREYARSLRGAPLSLSQKVACHRSVGRWFFSDLNFARMAADVAIGIAPWSWKLAYRASGVAARPSARTEPPAAPPDPGVSR
ncbi:MAG: glycosyltransferase family 2 protein [Acidobacteriota bacterium]